MDEGQKKKILASAESYIRTVFHGDFSGHDFYHSLRVYQMATRIAEKENASIFIVQMAALLHDVDDVKLFGDQTERLPNAVKFMKECGLYTEVINEVCNCIEEVSFKGTDTKTPTTLEAMIVQDADRIDAIGAIGIARAFAFGGNKNRMLYDPNEKPLIDMNEKQYRSRKSCSINHFYEKLLMLKDMMNTGAAKQIAEERHQFMQNFLDEFYAEWKGER